MIPFRKVGTRIWDDERIADLDPIAKLVWVYLLTGKHTTSLPGLWIVTSSLISDGLRVPLELVEAALSTLEKIGRIQRDVKRRMIRLPNAPKHNPADNARVVKSWHTQWEDLPECALKYQHLRSLRQGIESEKTTEAWEAYFGQLDVDAELRRCTNSSYEVRDDRTNSSPSPSIDLDLDPSLDPSKPDLDPGKNTRAPVAKTVPEPTLVVVEPDPEQQPAQAPDDLATLVAQLDREGKPFGKRCAERLASGSSLAPAQIATLRQIREERAAQGARPSGEPRAPPRGRSSAQRCPESDEGLFKGKVY